MLVGLLTVVMVYSVAVVVKATLGVKFVIVTALVFVQKPVNVFPRVLTVVSTMPIIWVLDYSYAPPIQNLS